MTDLADTCDELTSLLAALAPALIRDNSPSDGRRVLSAGGVVNIDVLHAIILINAEIPDACATAADLAGEPWRPRPLETCLRAIPRFRDRLHDLGRADPARHLEVAVARWMTVVKFALGLRTPDTPVGYDCPLHAEPSPLLLIGSEGFLKDDRTVLWQQSGLIACRYCGAEWSERQWLLLGQLLLTEAVS